MNIINNNNIYNALLNAMDDHIKLAYCLIDKIINETTQKDIEQIRQGKYYLIDDMDESNKDVLSEGWLYFIHDPHCKFSNKNTGQNIEIHLGENEWIENLDPYFFYEYIKSTEEYKYLTEYFRSPFKDMLDFFEKLATEGIMEKIYKIEYRKIKNLLEICPPPSMASGKKNYGT